MTNPPRLVARTPEDVLALVPVLLGFHPTHSLVMLTFGARRPFHARVDVPAARRDIGDVVDLLVAPVAREGATSVVLVLYADDGPLPRRFVRDVIAAMRDHGVEVKEALRVSDGRWFPLLHQVKAGRAGRPFDISAHPFLADAVQARLQCVRVIHGKGLGSGPRGPVLKASVNRWLQQIVARILKRRGYDLSEPKRVGRPKKVAPKTTEQQ